VKVSYIQALLKDTNPYFVLVTRNPYAACYRAALGKARDMKNYAKFMTLEERVEICAQHWSNAMNCALEDSAKVNNFTTIRFEDVLQNPDETIQSLCDFLDLTYDEGMLPQEDQKIPFGSRFRDRWYPLRPDVNQRYLDEIPDRYVHIIEEYCKPIAQKFDYSPQLS
jgi:hypothetical protein